MMDLSFLAGSLGGLRPIYELLQDESVQRSFNDLPDLDNLAFLFYSPDSGDLTVNLIPSLIVLILAAIFALPLLGIPILDIFKDAMSGGYGAPSTGYGPPATGYGAPSTGYDTPSTGYDTPSNDYSAPVAAAPSYHGRSDNYNAIANLQEQVSNLQDYYGNSVGGAGEYSPVGSGAEAAYSS